MHRIEPRISSFGLAQLDVKPVCRRRNVYSVLTEKSDRVEKLDEMPFALPRTPNGDVKRRPPGSRTHLEVEARVILLRVTPVRRDDLVGDEHRPGSVTLDQEVRFRDFRPKPFLFRQMEPSAVARYCRQ